MRSRINCVLTQFHLAKQFNSPLWLDWDGQNSPKMWAFRASARISIVQTCRVDIDWEIRENLQQLESAINHQSQLEKGQKHDLWVQDMRWKEWNSLSNMTQMADKVHLFFLTLCDFQWKWEIQLTTSVSLRFMTFQAFYNCRRATSDFWEFLGKFILRCWRVIENLVDQSEVRRTHRREGGELRFFSQTNFIFHASFRRQFHAAWRSRKFSIL